MVKRDSYISSLQTLSYPIRTQLQIQWKMDKPEEFELKFWDEKHNLRPGQQATITLKFDEDSAVGDRLEGVISRVEQCRVWITGRTLVTLIK